MQKASKGVIAENRGKAPTTLVASTSYSGPIPPASELRKYEDILPGSADRILQMAERQSSHRQEMESRMLDASIKSEKAGQRFGFCIFIAVIIIGGILLWNEKDILGMSTLVTAVAGIVSLFIYGRHSAKKELWNKKQKNGNQ